MIFLERSFSKFHRGICAGPTTGADIESKKRVLVFEDVGDLTTVIRLSQASAMAVATPGSPISTGLFLVRRPRI